MVLPPIPAQIYLFAAIRTVSEGPPSNPPPTLPAMPGTPTSPARFTRLQRLLPPAAAPHPLQGIFRGTYGLHGIEWLQLAYLPQHDMIMATKLTGQPDPKRLLIQLLLQRTCFGVASVRQRVVVGPVPSFSARHSADKANRLILCPYLPAPICMCTCAPMR